MFWKKDKKTTGDTRDPETKKEAGQKQRNETMAQESPTVEREAKKTSSFAALPTEYGVLKGFYVSEKASVLNALNQYVFKVFDNTTKNEVKKQVEKSFNVKVKGVKMINLPKKKKNVGRHSGF